MLKFRDILQGERMFNVIIRLLQSVAAIIIGLQAFNISVLGYLADGNLIYLVKPIQIILGLAGAFGLLNCFTSKC